MLLEDFYQIFAELSVAFAGFAGVVGAFSKFRVAQEAITLRVRFLILVALTVLIGSILPPVLVAINVSEVVTIRVSALVMGICIAPVLVWAWRSLRPLQRAGLIQTQTITVIIYILAGPLVIGYFVVAAGGLPTLAAAIYLGGLFFGIVCCCWYFVLLMFSVDIGRRD